MIQYIYKLTLKDNHMKELRQKIRDIRNSLQLIADSRKSGGGGTWEFVSLSGLYSSLNPLLDEKDLDIEIEDIYNENGEFIKVSIIDLESGASKSSTMKINTPDIKVSLGDTPVTQDIAKQIKSIIPTGIQYVQNREAQKSFFVRTAIISLLRLNILTSKETGVTNIAEAKGFNNYNTLVAKLKLKAGAEYIKKVEAKYQKPINQLDYQTIEKLLNQVEKKIAERKGAKNESK